MVKILQKQSPARIIALGFLSMIFLGSILLWLPCSIKEGASVTYLDTLYTATSAVCVTGLNVLDPGSTFTPFGQVVLACLIQIGGLGVAAVGAGIMLAMGRKLNLKGRKLVREAGNLDSAKGVISFLRTLFVITLVCEGIGAVLSFFVFIQEHTVSTALGLSLFHSIAAFNNSGFDILGNGQNLALYKDNVYLNLVTCALIFFGGIGFLVIKEVWTKKFRWKRFSMHTKVVLSVSLVLTAAGTLLLKLTEDMTWLGAFFHSVSARTAGFSTYPLGTLSNAGLLVITVLMFIGASSGSTGGGIKTSTFFVLLLGMRSAATNQSEQAFHYAIPEDAFRKASVITMLGLGVVAVGTYVMSVFEPQLGLMDIFFEVMSAFSTAGLSTGITSDLSVPSRLLSVLIMYIGRLGPLTVATLWYFTNGDRVRYPEGNIAIG